MKNTHRVRRPVLVLLPLLLLVAAVRQQPATSTTIVLVRHAEKAAEGGSDPVLSPQGVERSRALALALRDAGVSAIVTTELKRTQLTAAPLAADRHLTPEIVRAGGAVPAHARAVAQAVRRHAGQVVLVVGHSNTIPAIIGALGGPKLPDLCDSEYGSVFIMTLPTAGEARLIRARYGAADAASDAGCASMRTR